SYYGGHRRLGSPNHTRCRRLSDNRRVVWQRCAASRKFGQAAARGSWLDSGRSYARRKDQQKRTDGGSRSLRKACQKTSSMKIALIGFGKMVREIDSDAREHGEMITRVFEWDRTVTPEALADVDICIEFWTPDAVVQNIRAAVEACRDIVA